MTSDETTRQAATALSKNITDTLQVLLKTKHLYQSISTPLNSNMMKAFVSSNVGKFQTQQVETVLSKLYSDAWYARETPLEGDDPFYGSPTVANVKLAFNIPDVKLFCYKCDRIEPFNYLYGRNELENHSVYTGSTLTDKQPNTQIFVFSFLCQSCKSIPEVFLVRRQGGKLTLCGRSPIEHVEQPRSIPKVVAHYYSDAVVAHQSGQTLAGVFLFRVLIEQWVQSQTEKKYLKVDQALDDYISGLPNDFKERFPSFRTLYEELSADIHSATGSAELFEKARKQILEHFEARRLFKL
jgi:hypothetical protein